MFKILSTIIIIILFPFNNNVKAQAQFEGVITYSISFEDSGLPKEALAIFKNLEAITKIKSDKFRMELMMPMQSTVTIVDNKSKNSVTLVNIMKKKFAIKMNEADIIKDQAAYPKIVIKYTNELKMLAGYNCKKAEISLISGKGKVMNVYYTEEIQTNNTKAAYIDLKGFPLEYSSYQDGILMKFTVKSISKTPVADSNFEIPEGYIYTTMEQFQKEAMKQIGGQ